MAHRSTPLRTGRTAPKEQEALPLRDNTRPAMVAAASLRCSDASLSGVPCRHCMAITSDVIQAFLGHLPPGLIEPAALAEAVYIHSADA